MTDVTDTTTELEPTTPEVQADTTTETPALDPQALAKELERARKEAAKYRTRARELEQAEQARTQQTATAEEKLTAAETRARELEQAIAVRDLQDELKSAGVTADSLEDALDLYLAAVDRAEEGNEPTVEEFLAKRAYLKGTPSPKAATLPAAPGAPAPSRAASEVGMLEQQLADAEKTNNRPLVIALRARLHAARRTNR